MAGVTPVDHLNRFSNMSMILFVSYVIVTAPRPPTDPITTGSPILILSSMSIARSSLFWLSWYA